MVKNKTTKKGRPKKIKELPYKAYIKVLGKTYEASGESTADALSKLTPKNCKGRGILTVEKDGVKKERILMPMIVFRLFNTQGLSREIALKNASLLFGL